MFRRSDHRRTLAAARQIPHVLRVGHVIHQSRVTGPTDHRAQLPVLPRMRPQVQHDLPQLWHCGRFLVMAYATSTGNLRRRTGTSQCCSSKSAFTTRRVGDRRRFLVHQVTVALQQVSHPDSPGGVNAKGEGYRQGTPQRAHHKNRRRFQCSADLSRHSSQGAPLAGAPRGGSAWGAVSRGALETGSRDRVFII